jgi:hypothetical protein
MLIDSLAALAARQKNIFYVTELEIWPLDIILIKKILVLKE